MLCPDAAAAAAGTSRYNSRAVLSTAAAREIAIPDHMTPVRPVASMMPWKWVLKHASGIQATSGARATDACSRGAPESPNPLASSQPPSGLIAASAPTEKLASASSEMNRRTLARLGPERAKTSVSCWIRSCGMAIRAISP